MIPQIYIDEWRQKVNWQTDAQVEQDLIISRALVEIFSHPYLAENLAFRGGTALYKLYMQPVRYSEDLDLVQVKPGPIGPVYDAIREKLGGWLENEKRKIAGDRATFIYRVSTEQNQPLRLKVEINTGEQFTVLGLKQINFSVHSRWFTGEAPIQVYGIDELLATKVRALYQRKKGRDLFDLWMAFKSTPAQPNDVMACFLEYMKRGNHDISRAAFEQNLCEKLQDEDFIRDIQPLIVSGIDYRLDKAMEMIVKNLAVLIPGDPWRGLPDYFGQDGLTGVEK